MPCPFIISDYSGTSKCLLASRALVMLCLSGTVLVIILFVSNTYCTSYISDTFMSKFTCLSKQDNLKRAICHNYYQMLLEPLCFPEKHDVNIGQKLSLTKLKCHKMVVTVVDTATQHIR